MSWPTPQDYNEAIQNPHLNFADEELRAGTPEVNNLGLPQASTGAFASAYRIKCAGRDVAVRCFLQSVSDQHSRYRALAESMHGVANSLFVPFQYLEKGILVAGTWHPIVKMDWVDGQTLDAFIRRNKDQKETLLSVAESFKSACEQLQQMGIAHGDLQHGNIMIQDGSLRLIDYDGMFVSSLTGRASNELGHPNFQHPGRSKSLFDPSMDNFSSWVIYQSLVAIAHEPSLIQKLRGCEECLLCRHLDYAHPARSAAFHIFEASESDAVRQCGRTLRSLCQLAPDAVPPLSTDMNLGEPEPLDAQVNYSDLLSLVVCHEGFTADHGSDLDSVVEHAATTTGFPTIRQYSLALNSPREAFTDPELKGSRPIRRGKDFWRQIGKESVVFAVQSKTEEYAIKCFLGDDPTRAERYKQFAEYYKNQMPWRLKKHFLRFDYQPEGIKITGKWYPIVKMEWISAYRLDDYIASTPHSKHLAYALLGQWRELMYDLTKAGISHGNLEPGNIFIHEGQLRLVDYDTAYTPTMADKHYEPLSFPNVDMVHPRMARKIGPTADHFSSWIVDTALVAWCTDPALFNIQENRRGRLLFRSTDLTQPANSKLFALLFHNNHGELHNRAQLLYRFLYMEPDAIPPLQAQALPLLPAEVIREYRLRKLEVGSSTAAVAVSVIAIMVFSTLPYGSIIALLPITLLILTIRSLLAERRKGAKGKE